MNIAELIALLETCPRRLVAELPTGEKVTTVWINEAENRLILDAKENGPDVIAPGWRKIY